MRHPPRHGLSLQQEDLWYQYRSVAAKHVYNIPAAVRLQGVLDMPALRLALDAVAKRHHSLWCSFPTEGGAPHRRVGRAAWPLEVIDVSREASPEQAAMTHLSAAAMAPFVLEKGPLLRATVARLGAEDHVLLLLLHHMLTDGWGMAVLAKELTESYSALRRGQPLDLPAPRRQYPDFVAAQVRYMISDRFERDLAYWSQAIDPTRELHLPHDHERPATTEHCGDRLTARIPASRWSQLSALLGAHRVTPFVAATALFTVVLRHWSGQSRFLIGTDFANRNDAEEEDLVGLCANQAVLPIDFPATTTLVDWMKHLASVIGRAREHAQAPFGAVVDALRAARDDRRSPLFQTKIVGQPGIPPLALEGLRVSRLDLPHQTAKFDLLFSVSLEADGWSWDVEYDRHLFDEEAAGDFLAQMEFVAAGLEGHLARDVRDVLADLERRDLSDPEQAPLAPAAAGSARVAVERPSDTSSLPATVRGRGDGRDLASWFANHRTVFDELLLAHGSVLFRGFSLAGASEFEVLARGMARGGRLMDYEENTSPRTSVVGHVATSTDYPSNRPIFFHHEHSYSKRPPRKLFFFCLQAPRTGGATPLVSSRAVTRRLRPALRAKFRERGWTLVQNFRRGIGRSWEEVFRCTTRDELEAYCRDADIALTWNDANHVRALYHRGSEIDHPETGEALWFNHVAFWHASSFDPDVRARLGREFERCDWPCHTRYGDGSEIADGEVREIAEAYEACAARFDWQAGDLLVLDNMLAAHGREAFEPPRHVLFCMAEPFESTILRERPR